MNMHLHTNAMPRASIQFPPQQLLDGAYHEELYRELCETGVKVGDTAYFIEDAETAFLASDPYSQYVIAHLDATGRQQAELERLLPHIRRHWVLHNYIPRLAEALDDDVPGCMGWCDKCRAAPATIS